MKKILHTQLFRSVSFRDKSKEPTQRKSFLKVNHDSSYVPVAPRVSLSYDDILTDHGVHLEDVFDELIPLPTIVHKSNGVETKYNVTDTLVCRERSWSCNDGSDTITPKPLQIEAGVTRKIARSSSMRLLRDKPCMHANGENTTGSKSDHRIEMHVAVANGNDSPDCRPKSNVGQKRSMSLYKRERKPHFCEFHKKVEPAPPRPSAWSFGKHQGNSNSGRQLSPRGAGDVINHHSCNRNGTRSRPASKQSLASSTSSELSLDNLPLADNGVTKNTSQQTAHETGTNNKQCDVIKCTSAKKPSSLPRPIRSASFHVTRPKSVPLDLSAATGKTTKHSTSVIEGAFSEIPSCWTTPPGAAISPSSSSTLSVDGSCLELVVPDDNDNNDDYPDPYPPVTRKPDIFNPRDFTQVDQRALQVPDELVDDLEGLMVYLLVDLQTDIAKVRAIYRWLVSQHFRLHGRRSDITPDSPLDLLYRIQEGRYTYAELFGVLCRKVDIPCVVIHGVAKSVAYDVGDKVSPKKMRNSWNAVYVDNAWRLIHVYWAGHIARGYWSGRWSVVECDDFHDTDVGVTSSQNAPTVNDFYFLTDPVEFISKCFPEDPSWQLLSKPISKTEFEELPFLQPAFHELKLRVKSHNYCVVHTDNGKVEITLEIPADKVKRYRFKYKLLMSRDREAEGEYDDILLDRYLLHYTQGNTAVFEIRFPIRGTFRLELHCKDSRRPLPSDWICDYKVVCTRPMYDCQPLPVVPAIGWGPGDELEGCGLESLTHKHALVNLDKEVVTFIRFAVPKDRQLELEATLLKNNESCEDMNSHVTIEYEDETTVVHMSPSSEGEYALQLFVLEEDAEGQKHRRNVCNYLMHRTLIVEDPALADIRTELRAATETGDVESLSLWIERFLEKNMEDRGDLAMAKKQYALVKLNRDIREAIERKDLDLLERTMASMSDTSMKHRLGHLANEAEAMRSRLRRLKRLKHEVLALNQKTISELRSYPKPPPPVHGVMAATFLLLGNKESDVKKWSRIQGLINKKGKMALKRRVAEFNIDDVDPVLLKRVQTILSRYDLESVRIASVGAATFYEWAHSMTGDDC